MKKDKAGWSAREQWGHDMSSSEDVIFEQRHERSEEENHVAIWEKRILGEENSRGKGPGLGARLTSVKISTKWVSYREYSQGVPAVSKSSGHYSGPSWGVVCRTIKSPYLRLLFHAWAPGQKTLCSLWALHLGWGLWFAISEPCVMDEGWQILGSGNAFVYHPLRILRWL